MSCEQIGCQSDVFSSCSNHCTKNLCLKHVVEHGDAFLKNFVVAIDQLENISHLLIDQLNLATAKIAERRQIELNRIQSFYDEKQFYLRQKNLFAENADRLIKTKSESNCRSNQHDVEQLKIYAKHIGQYLIKNEETKSIECKKKPVAALSDNAVVVCPLMQPNAYGMCLEHDLRFGCQSGPQTRFTLLQHCEYYHRMLPECAARLRDAVFAGQPIETMIFSPNEILKNENYHVDCPLTDPNNVFGALGAAKTLRHVPCGRKSLSLPSLTTHFNTYHRMQREAARKLFLAIKYRTMPDDEILFEPDEIIGTFVSSR